VNRPDETDVFRPFLESIGDAFRGQHRHDLGSKYQTLIGSDYDQLKVMFLPTGEFDDDVLSVDVHYPRRSGFNSLMGVYADKFCKAVDARA